MKYLIQIFSLVGLIIFPQIVFAKNLICNPQTTRICNLENCNNAIPEITIKVDIENKKYARCVNKECKSYNSVINDSGLMILVTPTAGTFIKINKLDNSFIDVATLYNVVLLNFGLCN